MDDIQLKLDNIRSVISQFKIEQESLILKTGESLNNRNVRRQKTMTPVSGENNKNNNDDGSVNQIINVDAVIMPVASNFVLDQRLWPQALIAKYNESTVSIGNIESHGTLWKLISRPDGYAGHRVYIQSSVCMSYILVRN
jgi:hypothetical protein